MKKQISLLSLYGLLLIYFLNACTRDKVINNSVDCSTITVTYDDQIKPILDAKCADAGCHNSNDATAGVIVSNYNSLKPYLDNGLFKTEVITDRTMPIGEANTLTKEEYNLIVCWEEQGFLESTDVGTPDDLCPNTMVTYTENIQGLFERKCANSGCHNSNDAAAGLRVDSYTSILATINAGSFEDKIVNGGHTPALSLLQPELDLINCWKVDGYSEGTPDTCVGDYSYNKIQPILQNHCGGCHNATTPQAGVDVTSYAGMASSISTASSSTSSFELRVLIQKNMPPNGSPPLTQSELDSLDCWRKAGFPEN
ncbi:MAG: hypothetical protein MK212_03455 [Saprospiraceae bacterium]|nr:hypothetical protein [Saprospiraceae bacterium]